MPIVRPVLVEGASPVSDSIRALYHTCKILECAGVEYHKPILWSVRDPENVDVSFVKYQKIAKMDYSGYQDFMLRNVGRFWPDDAHGLFVQLDGYPINPSGWRDDFMSYDYIGAPWPVSLLESHNHPIDKRVGNGGFSLRSARLIRLCAEHMPASGFNEDARICIHFRKFFEDNFDIRYAPVELAARFSMEQKCPEHNWDEAECFGFHGWTVDRMHRFGLSDFLFSR